MGSYMLLVLFTIVSARLDSIMLTMLFSGYNIEALTDHTDHNTQSRPLSDISLWIKFLSGRTAGCCLTYLSTTERILTGKFPCQYGGAGPRSGAALYRTARQPRL